MKVKYQQCDDLNKRLCVSFELALNVPGRDELCNRDWLVGQKEYNRVVILLGQIVEHVRTEQEKAKAKKLEIDEFVREAELKERRG